MSMSEAATVQDPTIEVNTLWRRYKLMKLSTDRDSLILHYLPMVERVASQVARRFAQTNAEDLVTSGTMGLMRAIERYDIDAGTDFTTFAYHRIRGAMLDEMRGMDCLKRSTRRRLRAIGQTTEKLTAELDRPPTECEVASALKMTSSEYQRATTNTSTRSMCASSPGTRGEVVDYSDEVADTRTDWHPFGAAERNDLKEYIMGSLAEREKLIVTLYYYEHLTLKEIGAALNITESRVSQLLSNILNRLRTKLAA